MNIYFDNDMNNLIDNTKSLINLYNTIKCDNLIKAVELEAITGFEPAPIVIVGEKYGDDIIYNAKFLFINRLIGSLYPAISDYETIRRQLQFSITRFKKLNPLFRGLNRKVYVLNKVYDHETINDIRFEDLEEIELGEFKSLVHDTKEE